MVQMQHDPVMDELTRLVILNRESDSIAAALSRVERSLAEYPDRPQAWEPLSVSDLPFSVSDEIRSGWVFILRARASFGAERHPNSHQRTMALSGDAVFELLLDDSWTPWPIGAGTDADDLHSSVSIAPSTWHRISVGQRNFVSLSFHTVPAEQLIEETPVGEDLSVTEKRLYHA